MKRILRSALAGVLCLAMLITPCTVSNALGADATFESVKVNNDWTVTISGINWNNANTCIDFLDYAPYNALVGEYCYGKQETDGDTITTASLTQEMKQFFDNSGDYVFYAFMHSNQTLPGEANSCVREVKGHYERPAEKTTPPTKVRWNGYILEWDSSTDPEATTYCVEETWIKSDGTEFGPWYEVIEGCRYDLSDSVSYYYGQEGCKALKCTVKTLSNVNVLEKANSEKVASPVLYFDKETEKVNSKLEGVQSPEQIKNVFSSDGDKSSLMVAMTTEKSIAEKVKEIESRYNATEGITVEKAVSGEVGSLGVNAGNIKVIGAGLNASNGESVTLKITKTEEEVGVPSECYNPVQLDIKLDIAGTNKTNLDIPISITMPIPKGVEKQGLVIYHVHSNGQKEFVSHIRNNADGTITFAVKDFSTFVFANKKGAAGSDNDPDKKRTTYRTPVENAIKQAVATGGTTEISGITALSFDEMKELSKNPDAKLVMHFTYKDEKYKVIVTGKDVVVDPTIPWYGPLYLVGKYGNALTAGK